MSRLRRPLRRAPQGRSLRASYAIAAACLLAIGGLLVLGATAQRGLPGSDHYELTADFANAANLGRYAEIRIAGRRVGQVTEIALHGGASRVRLQLNGDVRPLREGTTARVRLKGLLGAKFVELRPARRGAPLRDGATIPTARTSTTVELFDLFEALDQPRRAHLQATLRGLGTGFLGRGEELNDALADFPSALGDLTAVASAINAHDGAAARFAPSLDAAAGAFDPVRDDLTRGWQPQARAVAPFVDRRPAVQATLEQAPPALDAVRDGLHRSDPLLRQTARLSRSVQRLTVPAPAALRATTALLRDSRPALRTANTLLRQTADAVPPTVGLTRRVDPLIDPVGRALRGGLPLFAELERRHCDLLGFARNWRSMLAYGIPSPHPIGPQNGLRVTLVASQATAEQVVGDLPAIGDRSKIGAYGKPCALGPVIPLAGGSR
ncbi:MlaD family protein [Patulibacter medicamentivorans]|uniref:MlaD family protein n=1 Tax=Patulibacter medicamentivorans TaxID=1097667 RepID=UPI000680DEE8|nr:MlaD family protein [Patulibacter medicamentivorans]